MELIKGAVSQITEKISVLSMNKNFNIFFLSFLTRQTGSGDTVNLTLLTQEEYDMFKADAEAATQAEQAKAEAEAAAFEAAQAAAAPAQQVLEQNQEEVQAFEAQMVCVLNFL